MTRRTFLQWLTALVGMIVPAMVYDPLPEPKVEPQWEPLDGASWRFDMPDDFEPDGNWGIVFRFEDVTPPGDRTDAMVWCGVAYGESDETP